MVDTITSQKINRIQKSDVVDFKFKIETTINAFDMYQKIATQSAIYPGQGTPLGLAYVALKGAGEAGEFAEHVGKAMRDDGLLLTASTTVSAPSVNSSTQVPIAYLDGQLTADRKEALIKEIGDQLWYLSAKCNELGINFSHAALVNLEKLLDRTERNALQGSGDLR